MEKNRIWVFGDSFAKDRETSSYTHEPYPNLLAKKLNTSVVNFGKGGTSFDWVVYHYHDVMDLIQKGDVVIVVLTSTNRRWIFESTPSSIGSHSLEKTLKKTFNEEEIQVVKKILSNPFSELVEKNIELFVELLSYHQKEKEFTAVVLPAFKDSQKCNINHSNVIKTKGFLHQISIDEVLCEEDEDSEHVLMNFFKENIDPRMNHMTEQNHKILADKLFYSIRNLTDVDLSEGFHKEVINIEQMAQLLNK